MEQIKKLILGLKALDLARIGDQTMGGEVTLAEALEDGVEYTVTWDGIKHKITCEGQRLAYDPISHGGRSERFSIEANGTTAYVTCKSMHPDVMIAVMEEVAEGGTGGGGAVAAPDPVVFTMAGAGDITCSKTFEECLELCNNGNCDAVLSVSIPGQFSMANKSVSCTWTDASVSYTFANESTDNGLVPMKIQISPDGITMGG